MQEEIKQVEKVVSILTDFIVNYSFQIIGAVIIVIVGSAVSRMLFSFLINFFDKREYDPTISKFSANLVKYTILGFAVMIALGKFGITIAPFIAAITAVAFGASFAIQGPSFKLRSGAFHYCLAAFCSGKHNYRQRGQWCCRGDQARGNHTD